MTIARVPWEAERLVSAQLARSLVALAAPQLAGASLEAFGAGWDNTAYLVDGRWLFRFPRREVAVALMENEIRVLPTLAARLPLRIPEPVYFGKPTADYPWPYAGYELLRGTEAALSEIPAARAVENVERLAQFLAKLHAQRPTDWPNADIPGDLLRRLDPEYRVPLARAKLSGLAAAGVLRDSARLHEILDASFPAAASPPGRSLVHGDFDARHLLVEGEGRIVAVIDWGDLHFGDPAVDLAIAHTFVPPALRARFRDSYGRISDRSWSFARLRALHNSLHVLEWAVDVGARTLEASARRWLAHLSTD